MLVYNNLAEKAGREHFVGASNSFGINNNTQAVGLEFIWTENYEEEQKEQQETVLKKDSPEEKHHFGS